MTSFRTIPSSPPRAAGSATVQATWFEWDDNRLHGHKANAQRYSHFIDRFAIDVVAGYVKQLSLDFFLLIGTHRRDAKSGNRNLSVAEVRQEADTIANLIVAQLFEQMMAHAEGNLAFRKSIGCAAPHVTLPTGLIWTASFAPLSPREREMAEQICNGRPNKQIAFEFGISEYAVENHLRRIYAKLGVRNRAALVARLMQAPH